MDVVTRAVEPAGPPGGPCSPEVVGLLAAAVLLASLGLLVSVLPGAFDWASHVHWLAQFRRALGEGVAYPRWIETSDGGYGNPVFLFYPPGAYYLASLAALAAPGTAAALKTTLVTALFASAVGMFLLARERLPRRGAVAAALLYVLAPGQLALLYGDLLYPSLIAMCVFPWVALAAVRGADGWLSASWALLLVCHPVTAALMAPWLALLVAGASPAGPRGLGRTAVALALGTCLAGAYVVPAAWDQSLVNLQVHQDPPHGSAADNLLFTSAPESAGRVPEWLGLNHLLGWTHTVQVLALCLGGAALLARDGAGGWPRAFTCGAVSLGVASFVAMSPPARPVWEAVPLLSRFVAGLPWRLGCPLTFGFCLVAAAACRGGGAGWPRLARGLVGVLVVFALGLSVRHVLDSLVRAPSRLQYLAAELTPKWPIFEYRPRTAPHLNAYRRPFPPPVAAEPPEAAAAVVTWQSARRVISWRSPCAGTLRIRTFAFPGWTCSEPGLRLDPATGGMAVDLPAGERQVVFTFEPTREQHAGFALSALALAALLTRAWRRRGG